MTWSLIVILVIVVLALAFVIERIVTVHRRQATTGREELIGKTVTTRTPLTPRGQVMFRGERWEAVSESGDIEEEKQLIITGVKDLVLYVKMPENK